MCVPENCQCEWYILSCYAQGTHKRLNIRVTSNSMPPLKITLYHDNGRVFSEADVSSSPSKLLMYIIPIIAAIAVMKALGFEG